MIYIYLYSCECLYSCLLFVAIFYVIYLLMNVINAASSAFNSNDFLGFDAPPSQAASNVSDECLLLSLDLSHLMSFTLSLTCFSFVYHVSRAVYAVYSLLHLSLLSSLHSL